MNTESQAPGKRGYRRKSSEERLEALEARLQLMKRRLAERDARTHPDALVAREIKKLQGRLRKFGTFALEHKRADLSNSTYAFIAMLERVVQQDRDPEGRERSDALEA
jgi:hypothetical protein